jgi:hypothetical protein
VVVLELLRVELVHRAHSRQVLLQGGDVGLEPRLERAVRVGLAAAQVLERLRARLERRDVPVFLCELMLLVRLVRARGRQSGL